MSLSSCRHAPDGRQLGGIARDRTSWTVYDLDSGAVRTFPHPSIGEWAWSADGTRVFLTAGRTALQAMDPTTGEVTVLSAPLDWEVTVALWMWGLPGDRVLTAYKSGFTLWRPGAGFTGVDKLGDDCAHAPSPDGAQLFTACRDGALWLHTLH